MDNHHLSNITNLKQGGVSHHGLAIYIKKVTEGPKKKELWKIKYFTMQKYNLQKKIL